MIAKSQSWFPIGATWYYNYQEELPFPAHGYIKHTVVKDTIVSTKLSKIIKREIISYNGDTVSVSSLIAREENSKVYYYNNDTFRLMYDFTLNVGDTLAINTSNSACDSVSPLIVDSIKNINISSFNLRIQYVSCTYYYSPNFGGNNEKITYPVIERIGYDPLCAASNMNFYFNPVCIVEDQFLLDWFRCYEDSNISYIGCYWQTHFPNAPCDTLINGSTGIPGFNYQSDNFNLFPDPAIGQITIETPSPSTIKISTIQGQLIKTLATSGSKTNVYHVGYSSYVVNVSAWPDGVYLVEVRTEKGIAVKKFIKE